MSEYPIDGCEVARRIVVRQLRGQDYAFVQGQVRALLLKYRSPETTDQR